VKAAGGGAGPVRFLSVFPNSKIVPAGHTPSKLERQQLNVAEPDAQTFWHWVRFALVAAAAQQRGASMIVDIGAGSGMLGDWMRESAPALRYRFQEPSELLDARLAARFGVAARHDEAHALPADCVVAMLDVLEHIDDDVGALQRLVARMEAGSTLVVTVPALQWAYSSWDTQLGHFRRYSRREVRELLTLVGLEVESSSYLFPELLVLLPARKLRRAVRQNVDFPKLSPRLNRLGYAISSTTAQMRRWWPLGTSVVAVAIKP
jgi:hypothetical protein